MKRWMRRKGLTARAFAGSLPVRPHWVTVSRWMNGHTKISAVWLSVIKGVHKDFVC